MPSVASFAIFATTVSATSTQWVRPSRYARRSDAMSNGSD
jgi:hypothetical protein